MRGHNLSASANGMSLVLQTLVGREIGWGGKFLIFRFPKWHFQYFQNKFWENLSCVKDLDELIDGELFLNFDKLQAMQHLYHDFTNIANYKI